MTLKTFSQNKISSKRFNATNKVYAKYWSTYVSGATVTGASVGSPYRHLAIDSTGAIYSVGSTSLGSGSTDAFLIKFDTSGAVVWQRALGQSGVIDYGQSIAIDSSDNIYVCGAQGSPVGSFVAKYNTSGTLIAQNRYGTASVQYVPMSIDVYNATGDVYTVGYYINASGYLYGLIQRWSGSDLSVLNSKVWGTAVSATNPVCYGIKIDQSTGNFYVAGQRQSGAAVMVGKHSADTALLWSFYYDIGEAYNIGIGSDGYIYVVGYYGSTSNNAVPFLMKINSSGAIIWTRRLTGITGTYGYSLAFDLSNNIIITVYSNTNNGFIQYIAKFSDIGNLLWQNYIDSSNADSLVSLITDVKGDIIFSVADTTNSKITLFHLPGDGSLNNASYNSGVNYAYYPSSLVNTVTSFAGPTTFSATQTNQTLTATSPMVSQTVSHTISTLAIG